MDISQATLLISSKYDLLFIAPKCLQGSGAVWWISVRQEPIISSMSYWILQECTQFSLSRRTGARGQGLVSAGPPQWHGEIWQDLALSKLHFSQMETAPLQATNGLLFFFFLLTEWGIDDIIAAGTTAPDSMSVNDCLRSIKPWSVPEPLVMRKINFDCCSWWSMRLRAISYSCRGDHLWRLIEHRLN